MINDGIGLSEPNHNAIWSQDSLYLFAKNVERPGKDGEQWIEDVYVMKLSNVVRDLWEDNL